jgi:hypothetical protein
MPRPALIMAKTMRAEIALVEGERTLPSGNVSLPSSESQISTASQREQVNVNLLDSPRVVTLVTVTSPTHIAQRKRWLIKVDSCWMQIIATTFVNWAYWQIRTYSVTITSASVYGSALLRRLRCRRHLSRNHVWYDRDPLRWQYEFRVHEFELMLDRNCNLHDL